MEKFTLVLNNQELEIVYRSLLEVPAKLSLPVIQAIERQIKEQEAALEKTKEEEPKNETTN